MIERPLVLFPRYEDAERAKGSGRGPKFSKPTASRQAERLHPKFNELERAMERRNITFQMSPTGVNPEFALVFEIIGDVKSFYSAVKKIDGLEWLFDWTLHEIESDEDFFAIGNDGEGTDKSLTGKLYCIMTNQRAMEELLSLWRRYSSDSNFKFEYGFTSLRDVFLQLKDIRVWGAKDRLEETQVLKYWKEDLELVGTQEVSFEIELFYRNNREYRSYASTLIRNKVLELKGKVIKECVVESIAYHCMLVSLPRIYIEQLINDYEEVELAKVDEIMFFRPVGQIAYNWDTSVSSVTEEYSGLRQPDISEPIIAVLDGMPMENHRLLANRLVVDDPDNWGEMYLVKDRKHGTAMTSLVIYGDLSKGREPVNRKVYVRPILRTSDEDFYGNRTECVPNDVILVDLVHRAVKRMFEGEGGGLPVAPTVKIINLSIGDPARQFTNFMSPLARLLDYLSYKYRVLFIISAGNHNIGGIDLGIPFSDFKELTSSERTEIILRYLEENSRNMRLLSPAESVNGLTIGATFGDGTQVKDNDRMLLAYNNELTSPISALGLGYNRSIKPDLFYNGGRKYLREKVYGRTEMIWVNNLREPGCKVAIPNFDGIESDVAFSFGTSDAAAQMSNEGARCYSVLEDIFHTQPTGEVPVAHASVLIKAMLAHGASWNENQATIGSAVGVNEKRIFKWLGNGIPNLSIIEECEKERITLIGYGDLQKEKAHVYSLPLPFDFYSQRIFRKLTVTLAYLSPIVSTKQKYRGAQLWFSIENTNNLIPNRVNTDNKAVRRGTLQHEIFWGDSAVLWDEEEEVYIKVNCMEDAGVERVCSIPYAIVVSFEVAEGVDMDIYSDVRSRIGQAIPVSPRT